MSHQKDIPNISNVNLTAQNPEHNIGSNSVNIFSPNNLITSTNSKKNNWSIEKIKLLMKWRQQARVYHWLHAKSSSYKSSWYVKIFYTTVFLSSLGLAQNFSTFFTEQSVTYQTLQIANAFVITLIGVLNVYLKTSKIAELVEKHSNTAKDFYVLQTEIEEQLAQAPEDREDGKIHIKRVRVKITGLTKDSPEISQKIWEKFSKAVKNREIFNESEPSILYTIAENKEKEKIQHTLSISPSSVMSPSSVRTELTQSVMSPTNFNQNEQNDAVTVKIDEKSSPFNNANANANANINTSKSEKKEPNNSTRNEKKAMQRFSSDLQKSGQIKPNIMKALDYQMARFN